MFSIPITVPFRDKEGVYGIDVSVDIDKIVSVNPLDIEPNSDVELNQLYDYRPMSELLLNDGRKLPVCEPPAIIQRYLDAYQQIENFYTHGLPPPGALIPIDLSESRGVVIPLFPKGRSCASSEGSTPA
jgi:hypothetical protein